MKEYSSMAFTNTQRPRLKTVLYAVMVVVWTQFGLSQGRCATPWVAIAPHAVASPVVANPPASGGCSSKPPCCGCKTTVTFTCTGCASNKSTALQISPASSPASFSKSIPGDEAASAQAGDNNKEQTKLDAADSLRFANTPVHSTFYFADGRPEGLWLKVSTNSARRLVGGHAVQINRDETVQFVSQGVDFHKVPLNSTFYFLPDAEQARPWIKAAATTATNPRDGRTYAIRSGLVTLANSPLHNNTTNSPAYAIAH